LTSRTNGLRIEPEIQSILKGCRHTIVKSLHTRSLFVLLGFTCFSVPIWSASTLQVGSGCTSGCSGDPNFSGQHASSIDIYDNSGGQNGQNPTLLIIGVPNVTGQGEFSTNSILSAFNSAAPGTPVSYQYGTLSPSMAGANLYGLKTNGYFGNFTASTGTDVYSFLGLNSNASQNWTNWSCVDLSKPLPSSCNGVASAGQGFVTNLTGFGIYVFAINSAALGKDYIQVNLQSNNTIPEGSYVIAYSGNLGTAFTNTGLQDVLTPEPVFRTLLTVGMILMVLVVWARKRVADKA